LSYTDAQNPDREKERKKKKDCQERTVNTAGGVR
jgi:hypothetical protein